MCSYLVYLPTYLVFLLLLYRKLVTFLLESAPPVLSIQRRAFMRNLEAERALALLHKRELTRDTQ